MWEKKILQHNTQVKIALEKNLRGEQSPFHLSIKGQKIGVHNWTHGLEEKSGRYLSPENANNVFIKKLTDYADPNRPKGELDIVVIMVSENTIEQFINTIEKVSVLLPEPTFKQALGYAKSHRQLAETKMVKTPQIMHPAFGQEVDITPQSGRVLQAIMRNVTANNTENVDTFTLISQLKLQKARREAENQQKVDKLLNTAVEVYSFQARDVLEVVAVNLQKNTPNESHIFTASVCFIGQDLTGLKEMLFDVKH